MAVEILCPACGQRTMVSNEQIGQTISCPRCGKILWTSAREVPSGANTSKMSAVTIQRPMHPPAITGTTDAVYQPAATYQPEDEPAGFEPEGFVETGGSVGAGRGMGRWVWPALAGAGAMLAVVAIAGAIFFAIHRADSLSANREEQGWETANADQMIQLKSDAEGMALSDNLRGAHGRYRELVKLVGARKLEDARLADLMQAAGSGQERVYSILLTQMEREAAASQSGAGVSAARGVAVAATGPSMAVNPPTTAAVSAATQPATFDVELVKPAAAATTRPAAVPATAPASSSPSK